MNQKSKKIQIHVSERTQKGTSSVRKVPKGLLVGNIYGNHQESTPILVDRKGFAKLYSEEGDTGLIYLELDENKSHTPALIDDVQVNPVSGELQHVVFRRVNLKEKLNAMVPIELVGENNVPGANVIRVLSEIEVNALPTDLPESFEIDISTLKEIGDSITIADLDYDKSKVTIEFSGDNDETAPVVILQEVKEEVEEEPESAEEAGGAEVDVPQEEKTSDAGGADSSGE